MANERTYPCLPCGELDESIAFYESLGFTKTYRQVRPNPYAVVAREDLQFNAEIYVMNADGTGVSQVLDAAGDASSPAWSPDGGRIAFVWHADGNAEIYVMNANGMGLARLTNSPSQDAAPAWSPDGTKIVFTSNRTASPLVDGTTEVHVMNADGTGVERLTSGSGYGPAWSSAIVGP